MMEALLIEIPAIAITIAVAHHIIAWLMYR